MNTTSVTSGAGTSTLPEHLSSPLLFSGVHVTWFLVLVTTLILKQAIPQIHLRPIHQETDSEDELRTNIYDK
jgi:hypothetical protein